MKTIINIAIVLLIFICSSCVQKTYKRTIVITLDVSKVTNLKKVGIRGENKPLSWDADFEMKEIVKDSLYKATITGETGYLFTEIKFTANDEFEFQNQPNRRIIFDKKKDTTFYKAIFNKRN